MLRFLFAFYAFICTIKGRNTDGRLNTHQTPKHAKNAPNNEPKRNTKSKRKTATSAKTPKSTRPPPHQDPNI